MSSSALETFSITRRMIDARADDALRLVHLSTTSITIDRTVGGVRMRVGVPAAAYRDLVIYARPASGCATLELRHRDSDLDVVIGSGDALQVATTARAWAAVLGKPVAIVEASVVVGRAFARQRTRAKPTRRSRFRRRRQPGVALRMATSFAGEREIIARD